MTKFLPALLAVTILPGTAMAAQMSAQSDATATKPATHKTMAHKTAKTTKTKTYDCTKVGNANKKACKH